jgi:Asp-tRNA(Asn)/Glu-tRNA(Gln) amidotransferase A subunit family amidase
MIYSMQTASTPRLKGRALRALVALVENPLTRPLIARKVLRDTGIGTLRGATLDEAPSVRPDLPHAGVLAGRARDADWPGGAGAGPGAKAIGAVAERPDTAAGDGFHFATAADFQRAYSHGRLTPDAVARRVLEAIRASDDRDPPLRAMVAVDDDDVLAQAAAATERWRAGSPLGPLDGVPIAVKDELDQAPYPTTVGTAFRRQPAAEDAFVVARLRAAGAVLIGKANMHEIGIDVTGLNLTHVTPRNPYDTRRYPGGSSSGPAAAVGAGLCPIAIGADGGGSIRIPASLCGVFGLKPTFGRVSESGAAPLAWSVAHVGPIAASADDLALAYAAIAGPDPRDPHTLRQPDPALAGYGDGPDGDPARGLRIGVFTPWFEHAEEEVIATCRRLLDLLEEAGATVVDVEIPDLELCRLAHGITILAEMVTSTERYHADHGAEYGPATRLNLALGRQLTGRDYVRAQQVRTRMTAHFQRAFDAVDVIATPAAARTAPLIRRGALAAGESDLDMTSSLMRFAVPANLTGHPALAVPAGYTAEGLPVGLQLIGRAWDEARLLDLARFLEPRVPRRQPALHFDLLAPG